MVNMVLLRLNVLENMGFLDHEANLTGSLVYTSLMVQPLSKNQSRCTKCYDLTHPRP